MVHTKKTKLALVALLTAFIGISVYAITFAQDFYKKGVVQGQDARWCDPDSDTCSLTQTDQEPHFAGCNAIL